jgi:hypothetical protein
MKEKVVAVQFSQPKSKDHGGQHDKVELPPHSQVASK